MKTSVSLHPDVTEFLIRAAFPVLVFILSGLSQLISIYKQSGRTSLSGLFSPYTYQSLATEEDNDEHPSCQPNYTEQDEIEIIAVFKRLVAQYESYSLLLIIAAIVSFLAQIWEVQIIWSEGTLSSFWRLIQVSLLLASQFLTCLIVFLILRSDYTTKEYGCALVTRLGFCLTISSCYHLYQLMPESKPGEALELDMKIVNSIVQLICVAFTWIAGMYNVSILQHIRMIETKDKSCKELGSSFYSHLTFSWLNPLVRLGCYKHLSMSDLDNLRPEDEASNIVDRYNAVKVEESSLLFNLFRLTRFEVFIQMGWALMGALLQYTGPYFLRQILIHVEDNMKGSIDATSIQVALGYCAGIFICNMIRSISDGQMYFLGRRIGLRVRSVIISLVYQKSLRRSKAVDSLLTVSDEKLADSGKIVNLMSVDAYKILEVACYMMYVWTTPLQAIICITFLVYVAGAPGLVGVSVMMIMVPVGAKIGKMITEYQKHLMKATDDRMSGVDELLQGIRIVKFFAWESNFMKKIGKLRENELGCLWRYMLTAAFSRVLWQTTPVLVAFLTFSTMAWASNKDLDATTAFTALTLFNALRGPLYLFPDIIVRIGEALVSLRRVEAYLKQEEIASCIKTASSASSCSTEIEEPQVTVKVQPDSVFSWSQLFSLKTGLISFAPKGLTVISGPTGAGKSSLLHALLGELSCDKGGVILGAKQRGQEHMPIAFASQQVWLQNATIRDNILFGSPYNAERYSQTIRCCALTRDLANLEGGDMTEVGEKGVNLSGGQKARISLARAVYSSSPIILMDDPLSAVDAPTAKFLFKNCILGPLLQNRTRILVTHNTALCESSADHIIRLENGQVTCFSPQLISPISEAFSVDPLEKSGNSILVSDSIEDLFKKIEVDNDVKRLTQDEGKFQGSVPLRVYMAYITAAGGFLFAFLLALSYCGTQGLLIANDWWLKVWADAYIKNPEMLTMVESGVASISNQIQLGANFFIEPIRAISQNVLSAEAVKQSQFYATGNSPQKTVDANYYLSIYAALAALSILAVCSRVIVVMTGSLKASNHIHQTLLKRLLCAPIRFFEKTPTGRILNRFGKDMKDVDQEVGFFCGDFLGNLINAIGVVLIIVIVVPWTIAGMIPISFVYAVMARLYIRSSRELKRLDSVSRSPIFSHFSETLSGATVIRAYSAQKRFLNDIHTKVDENHKAFFYLWVSNRWLGVRVDFVGSMVALTACLAVLSALHFAGGINPGVAGLSISYALSFSEALLWLVRTHAMMEMELNSVERLDEYMTIDQEPLEAASGYKPLETWPSQGKIQFDHLSLRYSSDSEPVLKNVSFSVKPGERVGIVGRTGAGKTTLSLALFRFLDFYQGTIYIDGEDISKLGLTDLRSRLTIIPQDPVLFSGSLRSNLDPFDIHNDAELWDALTHSNFLCSMQQQDSPIVSAQGASRPANSNTLVTLDMAIAEGGKNLSQGQRQLLCLARALLRRSKICILDEATASIDHDTDTKIQETIRKELVNCTLLCIAHRLRTVMDYDKILVLEKGQLKQFGSPLELVSEQGIFQTMCRDTGEFDELVEIAKKHHQ